MFSKILTNIFLTKHARRASQFDYRQRKQILPHCERTEPTVLCHLDSRYSKERPKKWPETLKLEEESTLEEYQRRIKISYIFTRSLFSPVSIVF